MHPQIFTGDMSLSELASRLANKRFRLQLVCEHCMEPVGDGYLLEKREEWVAKLLPALKARQ